MIKDYLNHKIEWFQDEENSVIFNADTNGISCKLKMNDFPSEPMYTFIILGEELSFDDIPDLWEINYID